MSVTRTSDVSPGAEIGGRGSSRALSHWHGELTGVGDYTRNGFERRPPEADSSVQGLQLPEQEDFSPEVMQALVKEDAGYDGGSLGDRWPVVRASELGIALKKCQQYQKKLRTPHTNEVQQTKEKRTVYLSNGRSLFTSRRGCEKGFRDSPRSVVPHTLVPTNPVPHPNVF